MRVETLLYLLAFGGSSGVMQTITPALAAEAVGMVGLASALATLAVLVYRTGAWRREIVNMHYNISTVVGAYGEETLDNLSEMDRRLDAIDHMLSAAADHRVYVTRCQVRTERRLERLEACQREGQGG